jgi:hypothetical protein
LEEVLKQVKSLHKKLVRKSEKHWILTFLLR